MSNVNEAVQRLLDAAKAFKDAKAAAEAEAEQNKPRPLAPPPPQALPVVAAPVVTTEPMPDVTNEVQPVTETLRLVDLSKGSQSVDLPDNPVDGDRVVVKLLGDANFTCIVKSSKHKIDGRSQIAFTGDWACITLHFTQDNWYRIG